jgi:hypothetical protein
MHFLFVFGAVAHGVTCRRPVSSSSSWRCADPMVLLEKK